MEAGQSHRFLRDCPRAQPQTPPPRYLQGRESTSASGLLPDPKNIMRTLGLSLAFSLFFSSCFSIGTSPDDQRAHIDQRTEDVLERLYRENSGTREQVGSAAGYAVFSNVGVDVLFVGGGGGYGLAVDRSSGKKTYMRMAEAGVGIGLGLKDFRVVFIFSDRSKFDAFVEDGWDVGFDATAAAEASGQGISEGRAASFQNGVVIYQLTETGLALRANLKGTKYYKSSSLN